jgi:hypothetical protein
VALRFTVEKSPLGTRSLRSLQPLVGYARSPLDSAGVLRRGLFGRRRSVAPPLRELQRPPRSSKQAGEPLVRRRAEKRSWLPRFRLRGDPGPTGSGRRAASLLATRASGIAARAAARRSCVRLTRIRDVLYGSPWPPHPQHGCSADSTPPGGVVCATWLRSVVRGRAVPSLPDLKDAHARHTSLPAR